MRAAEFVEREVPVDRHRDLRHGQSRSLHVLCKHPRGLVIRAVDQLVGGDGEPQHPRDPRVVNPVHRGPVERFGQVRVEDGLGRLQRHPLVDEGTTADAGGAQCGHVVAGHRLEQTGVRLQRHRLTEQLRTGPVPEDALVRGGRTGKGVRVRPCGPAYSTLEHQNGHAGLREPERRDAAAEPRPDDDDPVIFAGERHGSPAASGPGLRDARTRQRDARGSGPGQKGAAIECRHRFPPDHRRTHSARCRKISVEHFS